MPDVKIISTAGECKFNPNVICGVFKSLENCNYQDCIQCNPHHDEKNSERWIGFYDWDKKTITLRVLRYRREKMPLSKYDKNLCDKCGIMWNHDISEDGCPLCYIDIAFKGDNR